MKKALIGHVAVDSGTLMICDPSYIGHEINKDRIEEIWEATDGPERGGNVYFTRGHVGAAVAFRSGYGDGVYPAYAHYNKDGRVVKVEIDMG